MERCSLVVARAVLRGTVLLTSSQVTSLPLSPLSQLDRAHPHSTPRTQLFFVADGGAVGADGSGGRACLPAHSTAAAHAYAQHRMLRQRRWCLAEVSDVLLRRLKPLLHVKDPFETPIAC